jgi:hypothetical protein
MEVRFTKISDERHAVAVARDDGSSDRIELESRSFLRHDLAHLAIELELGIHAGLWGSVAAGGALDGEGLAGADMEMSESLAGPVQTLMRLEADSSDIARVLERVAPDLASSENAERVHERLRRLTGHWKATSYRSDMMIEWLPRGNSGDDTASG